MAAPPPTEAPPTIPQFEPPAWAREPVPETWGEAGGWFLRRQAVHAQSWFNEAEQEIHAGVTETPMESMGEEAERLITLGEEAAATFWERPRLGALAAVGVRAAGMLAGAVTVPLAGLKGRTLFGLPIFDAMRKGTEGALGMAVAGLNAIDAAGEQGVIGLGAEFTGWLLQGKEFDFTPQEFVAGMNNYTKGWTAASTYMEELWNSRMVEGLTLPKAHDRALVESAEAYVALEDMTMEAIRGGASPEEIEANSVLSNPVAELVGRLVLDPLNMIPSSAGRRMRMGMSKEAAMKLVGQEDFADYGRILETMKAEGAANVAGGFKGPVWKLLHPFRSGNRGLAGELGERVSLTLAAAMEKAGAGDPGDLERVLREFVAAGGKGDEAIVAQQFLKSQLGDLPVSRMGKQTTLFLRELATDPKTGEFSLAVVDDWFTKAKTPNEAIKNMLGGWEKAVERIYPQPKKNIVRRGQDFYRSILSRYEYMGLNPGWAWRNAAGNTSMSMLGGYQPFEGADVIEEFAKRWGDVPLKLRKGYGGLGARYLGIEIQNALGTIGEEFRAVRTKDIPKSMLKDFWKRLAKGTFMLKPSELFETAASERIVHQALGFFWKDHWNIKLPDWVGNLFPSKAQATAFERMAGDAISQKELYGALQASRLGRNFPNEILTRLDDLPGGLRQKILHAKLQATDADDFARRMQGLSGEVDDWLVKRLDDLAPEISKSDDLLMEAAKAEEKIIEDIEDAEEAARVAGILQPDEFKKQLVKDRATSMAWSEKLKRHVEANPEDGAATTNLLVDHMQAGAPTAKRVDLARDRTLAIVRSHPGPQYQALRSRTWEKYFTYSRGEWRRYWDDFSRKADEFIASRRRGEQLAFPGMEPAQQEEMAKLIDEWVETLSTTRHAVATISADDTRQILDELAEAGQRIHWGDMPELSSEVVEGITRWLDDEIVPQMHTTKAIGNRVALAERDYILYNYGEDLHIDAALSYLFPYPTWYRNTAMNVPRLLLYNPKYLEGYLDFKEAMRQINEEAQGLPWWEGQIKVPGTDFYFNLEASLNPLYNMITEFHDPMRTKTIPGQWLERIGNVGPSLDVALWALYAYWRFKAGEPEEARAAMGYLGTPTKAFRYATALLGLGEGRGITLEPWLWDDPLSFAGLDQYERFQVGRIFKQMENEGAATVEQLWDAGKMQSGDIWNEAVARMTKERAPGLFLSWFVGIGFKPRKAYDIQIQKARNAQYEFYQHAETAYDMSTDEGQAAYKEAQKALYRYYPFLSYIMLVRRGELERDKAYTWEVLNRLPPGSNGAAIKTAAGVDDPIIDLFYETRGDFSTWEDMDRAAFMASIEAMGAILGVPDKEQQQEWDRAIKIYGEVKAALRRVYGDDIWNLNDSYWKTRDVAGNDAAKAFADGNPRLYDFWDARNLAITESPILLSYWGSLDTLERVGENLLEEEVLRRWPNYEEAQAGYFKEFDKDEWREQRDYRREYIKQYPWLPDLWDFKDNMREEIAVVIEEFASEMKPPLGPVIRPDAELESVLVQRILDVVGAKLKAHEMLRGPSLFAGMGKQILQGMIAQPEGEEFLRKLFLMGPFTEQAIDYFEEEIEVKFGPEIEGGFYPGPTDFWVQLGNTKAETAIHELTHAWWEPRRGKRKEAFVKAVIRFAGEVIEPRSEGEMRVHNLAWTYVNGDPNDPSFHEGMKISKEKAKGYDLAFANGTYWNDHEMFAGLASGCMGDVRLLPYYLYQFYKDLFVRLPPEQPFYLEMPWEPEVTFPRYPIGAQEGTLAGAFPETTGAAEEALDGEAPSVVSYEGAAAGATPAPAGAPPVTPPAEAPPAAPSVEWPETLSWQFVKEYLGQTSFGLIQHFNTGLPLGEPIKARLEEIYAEYPLGFTDLASWLGFVRTLWRASLFSRGGLGGVTGLREQPRPLSWTSGAGAGRRFTPWG